nr:hypothetical protein [Tanacetum cinerariifolium]
QSRVKDRVRKLSSLQLYMQLNDPPQSRVKDRVRKLSSLQLYMQLNDPRPNFGYEPVDSRKNDSGNIWDYSDKEAAPATSWSTLPNRSLLCRPLPVGIGRSESTGRRQQAVYMPCNVSEEDQNNLLRILDNKESECMRLQMHKMGVDDFELLTMIGKGAFGEGGWTPEDHTLLCEAQKMYGNTWIEIAKVVSGTNKENNAADMNTNKGETTNGILLIGH